MLLIEWWGRDFYAAPDDDREDDVILAEVLAGIEIDISPEVDVDEYE